jgi:L-lactate dehydrogenase
MDAIASGKPRDKLREEIEQEVRYANISIIERIGASQYGIGMVCARIAEVILRDEQAVLPIGAYQKKYGVTLSLPAVLGAGGLLKVYEPEMSNEERSGLEHSAEAIRRALEPVRIDTSRAA